MAIFVGCFDASSAIFIGLAALISSGVTFEWAMEGYAIVPLCFCVLILMLWPDVLVEPPLSPGTQCGGMAPLSNRPLGKQILSMECGLLLNSTSIVMTCINFFIGTVNEQLVLVDPHNSAVLTEIFASLLPIGGIIFIPAVGGLCDCLGSVRTWLVLSGAMILFFALNIAHALTGIAALAVCSFVTMAFCRPLFYTLIAVYIMDTFGVKTFGRIYGLTMTFSGVINCLVHPLRILVGVAGFTAVNIALLVVSLSTLALPALHPTEPRRRLSFTEGMADSTPLFTPLSARISHAKVV
eukprot:NODE_1212_length_1209_cov_300.539861.p1 GENE.NODE_1212_length_1209_cov_300.539861~~NODE_1212_length_1209_cov_300.539861.p1  ORF type:complete len:348 (-),score=95.28 NODE_1212_length_1209_cov_300.539861:149-1036(-)